MFHGIRLNFMDSRALKDHAWDLSIMSYVPDNLHAVNQIPGKIPVDMKHGLVTRIHNLMWTNVTRQVIQRIWSLQNL